MARENREEISEKKKKLSPEFLYIPSNTTMEILIAARICSQLSKLNNNLSL